MIFFAMPKLDGITIDFVLGVLRSAAEKQGMELGPIEPKRYGGKPVHTFTGTLTKSNQKIVFTSFVVDGGKIFSMLAHQRMRSRMMPPSRCSRRSSSIGSIEQDKIREHPPGSTTCEES